LVRKILTIVDSGKEEFTEDLNLSLLIGPDRFAYLVYSKKIWHIKKLSVFEAEANTDLLTQIINTLLTENIDTNNYLIGNLTIQHLDALKKDNEENNFSITNWPKYRNDLKNILNYFETNHSKTILKDSFKTVEFAFKKNCKDKSAVLSYWQNGKLFLWTLDEGKITLNPVAHYKTIEDALYYILKCYKNSGFDPAFQRLYIAGALSEDSSIFKILYNYITNLDFVKNPSDLKIPEQEEPIAVHLFYDLLAAES
jgi:hypothetical protein